MGSSGGGTPKAPNIPPPPAGMIMPQGQTAVGAPSVPSFLPQDPNAMATGLTPEMLAAIDAQAAQQRAMPAQGGGMAEGDLRSMLAQLLAGKQQQGLSKQDLMMMMIRGSAPGHFSVRRGGSGGSGGYTTSDRGAGGNASSARSGGFGGF